MTDRSMQRAIRIKTEPDPYEQFLIAQAYRVGNLIFVSGQAATTPQGDVVAGGFDAQAQAAFDNLRRVLEAGGSSLAQIIKVNIYLTDMANFPKIIELRRRYFTAPYPADTIVEVSALALPELVIEIEAVALVEGGVG
jgi:2-iminobutanoate/2-iminopropanoate deaminase